MTREEAIKILKAIRVYECYPKSASEETKEAIDMAIEALSEPTVIRSKTLMPTKDFKEWAKRVRENNPSVIVIPCDAEVVSVETTATNTEKSSNCGDLISRADAIEAVASITMSIHLSDVICDKLLALPSADRPAGEWEEMEILCNPYPPLFCVECSECGYRVGRETYLDLENTFNFCPNCGADMRKKNNEQC